MAKSGWVEIETNEVNEGKTPWITPSEGLVISGELTKAFLVKQQDGTLTASYQIMKEDESLVNLGERFFFSDAIRGITIGSQVEITFTKEKELPKSRTQWLGKFRYQPGKGENVYKALKSDYDKRYAGKGDEVPF